MVMSSPKLMCWQHNAKCNRTDKKISNYAHEFCAKNRINTVDEEKRTQILCDKYYQTSIIFSIYCLLFTNLNNF